MFERLFHLRERGSSVGVEFRGAVATFLTMAYIIFVNPTILAAAGIPVPSAIACTAAAAGVCCILMGLVANFPLALASGMGLNAFIAYSVAGEAGSWQIAMGLVVLDGLIVLFLVLLGLREAVLNAIPRDLRRAIGAAIGLFIAFIGAVNAKLVIVPGGTLFVLGQNPDAAMPPVAFGNLQTPSAALAVIGLVLTGVLVARRVKGAIVFGILGTAAIPYIFQSIAFALNLVSPAIPVGAFDFFGGLVQAPTGWGWPDFSIAFQANVAGVFAPELFFTLLPLLLTFIMVDFFDTLGTITGIAEQANLTREDGTIVNVRQALVVDSVSASVGGLFGVSSVTSYIESAAGVSEGARTGLHTVFVGLLFLAAVFLAPIAGMVPAAATAPALILVGFLMCGQMVKIDFTKFDTAIPAFLTLAMMPFTYSIAHGIGFGFISYVGIKVFSGRWRQVHGLMYVIAVAFVAYFIWGKG